MATKKKAAKKAAAKKAPAKRSFLAPAMKRAAKTAVRKIEREIRKAVTPVTHVTPVTPGNRPEETPRTPEGRFPPGISGNPNGRPKKTPVTDAFRALLDEKVPGDKEGRTYAQLIALAAIRKAIGGNVDALKELTDRVEGKARQSVELTGRDGGPIDVSNLTPEQRDAELDKLAAELGYSRPEA